MTIYGLPEFGTLLPKRTNEEKAAEQRYYELKRQAEILAKDKVPTIREAYITNHFQCRVCNGSSCELEHPRDNLLGGRANYRPTTACVCSSCSIVYRDPYKAIGIPKNSAEEDMRNQLSAHTGIATTDITGITTDRFEKWVEYLIYLLLEKGEDPSILTNCFEIHT